MSASAVRRVDLVAVGAALIAMAMAAVYVAVMRDQGDQPLVWVLAVLVGGALAAAYGAARAASYRQLTLGVAGVALLLLGLVSILTIGLPILLAGALALLACARV